MTFYFNCSHTCMLKGYIYKNKYMFISILLFDFVCFCVHNSPCFNSNCIYCYNGYLTIHLETYYHFPEP